MCLTTTKRRPDVAGESITCYKVMYIANGNSIFSPICAPTMTVMPRYFMSMFINMWYKPGIVYTETNLLPANENPRGYKVDIFCGFHSYKRQKDAEEVAKIGYWKVIVKCEIPAGARYWTGNHTRKDKDYLEYCSESIKITAYKLPGEDNEWIDVSGERQ